MPEAPHRTRNRTGPPRAPMAGSGRSSQNEARDGLLLRAWDLRPRLRRIQALRHYRSDRCRDGVHYKLSSGTRGAHSVTAWKARRGIGSAERLDQERQHNRFTQETESKGVMNKTKPPSAGSEEILFRNKIVQLIRAKKDPEAAIHDLRNVTGKHRGTERHAKEFALSFLESSV